MECRILAIVDAHDAMTNDRPYKKAVSRQEAVEELQLNAGSHLDPLLADLFTNTRYYTHIFLHTSDHFLFRICSDFVACRIL